jgi:hypothetical protein
MPRNLGRDRLPGDQDDELTPNSVCHPEVPKSCPVDQVGAG